MKKSKFLKPFSFASLALLMGAVGVFAFAPLGASPSVANASEISTESGGLITPKKDDPVIYTTESGLEIKWGNATPSTLKPTLSSGNLTGFPYFTTTANSTTYTWVIIGKNPDLKVGGVDISRLFSTWKSLDSKFTTNGKYFFNNIYETTTPAGSAINAVIPSKTYVADLTSNSEIPSGCILAISNTETGSSGWSKQTYINSGNHYYVSSIEGGFGYSANDLSNVCKGYYTNDTFGFGSLLSSIQNTELTQMVSYWGTAETPVATTVNMHFFVLGHDTTYDNFRYQSYLTNSQVKLANTSQGVYLRTNYSHEHAWYLDGSGTPRTYTNTRYNIGDAGFVRPAFVLKIT